MSSYSQYFTREELRQRRWHNLTIKRLFPRPSRVAVDKITGTSIELYWGPNVLRIEESSEFSRVQQEAAEANARRRSEAIRSAIADPLDLGKLSRQKLRECARVHHCQVTRKDPHRAPLVAPAMLGSTHWDRIELEYLIHSSNWKVDYDHFRRHPVRRAEEIRTERLLFTIARVYPHLSAVCRERLKTELAGNPRCMEVVAIFDAGARSCDPVLS